jgi:hypothetical protein
MKPQKAIVARNGLHSLATAILTDKTALLHHGGQNKQIC